MPPLDRAVADIRRSVRTHLAEVPTGPVVVACSGGADSLALLAATAFEARHSGHRVVGVCVDHGLQSGSVEHTARVVAQMETIGADQSLGTLVVVEADGGGLEAAARAARYAALDEVAAERGAQAILLGHTRDDQAETVLLGLLRGSGARSLSGMAPVSGPDGRYHRPLLGIPRHDTERACRAEGLDFWTDPHNSDPAFTRVRARGALAELEAALGQDLRANLARTADLLRADADLLDELAEELFESLADVTRVPRVALRPAPKALRSRVLRLLAIAAGSPGGELTAGHVEALDRMLLGNRGGLRVQLPGHVTVLEQGGVLRFDRA